MDVEKPEIPERVQRKVETYRDVSRGPGRQNYYHADHFGIPKDNQLARELMYRGDVEEAYLLDCRYEIHNLSIKNAARRIIENPELVDNFFRPGEPVPEVIQPSWTEGMARKFGGKVCETAILHLLGERGLITNTQLNGRLNEEPLDDLADLVAMITRQGKEFIDENVPKLRGDRHQPIVNYLDALDQSNQITAEGALRVNYEIGVHTTVALLQVATAQPRWRNPAASPEDVAALTRASVGILSQAGGEDARRALAMLEILRQPYGKNIEISNGASKERLRFVDEVENLAVETSEGRIKVGDLPEGSELRGCPAMRLFPRLVNKVVELGLESGLIERELKWQAEPPLKNVIHILK